MLARSPQPNRPAGTVSLRRRDLRGAIEIAHESDWWDRCARMMKLEDDLARIQPALGLRVIKLTDGELTLTSPSAAASARLRQIAPRIVEGLRANGWLVDRLRFRAGAGWKPAAPKPVARTKAPIPASAIDQLALLIDDPQTPKSLQSALADLVNRQRQYTRTP